MQDERLEIAAPSAASNIVWTREEERGDFDVVVHFNGYSYNRRHARRNPGAFRILYLCESLSVYPMHFTRHGWAAFDAILTWNDFLAEYGGKFHGVPPIFYDFPYGAVDGLLSDTDGPLPNPATRPKAICQIAGDKYTPVRGQLYRARRNAARWFHARRRFAMDVYGFPPMNVPNYKGRVDSKLDTFQQYRYALCFENLYHPIWSRGYVTEKIFDCMYADCVPVYYGACNIEKYIPTNCFIDFRQFRDFSELEAFLSGQTDRDYLNYVRNIRSFLKGHNAAHRYSCFRLYEAAAELTRSKFSAPVAALPPGFFEVAQPKEKAAYYLMACGLKGYRFVHPFFNLIRRVGSWRTR